MVATHMRPPAALAVPPADRFFLLFEGFGPPVTAVWAFEASGTLDPQRLREAVSGAVRAHPKAGCRLARASRAGGWLGERLAWVPMELGPRVVEAHDGLIDDDDAVAGVLSHLQNLPMEPESGPLISFHLYPTRSGQLLAFRFHHALGDGIGALAFLSDVLAGYRGEPTSGPARVPEPLTPRLELRALVRFLWARGLETRFAAPDHVHTQRRPPEGPVAVAFHTLEPEQATLAARSAKAWGVTVNDLLLAAWSRALEQHIVGTGRPAGTFRVMVNEGLRDGELRTLPFDNASAAFPVWVGPEDRASGERLLRTVARQTRECRERGVARVFAGLARLLVLPSPWARQLVLPGARRPVTADTLILSNLGRLPVKDLAAGGGVEWLRCIPVVRPPEGAGVVAAAGTVGSTLTLTLGYLLGALTPVEAERLVGSAAAALASFGDPP